MNHKYMVIYERQAEDNWGAWAQDIPGAYGAVESFTAVKQSLLEAIAIMSEYLQEQGLTLATPTSTSIDFAEFDPDPISSHYEIEWLTIDLPELSAIPDKSATQAA